MIITYNTRGFEIIQIHGDDNLSVSRKQWK